MIAVAVLGAVVAWARCYDPQDLPASLFFTGCFSGAVTDPPVDGKLTIVFEKPPAPSELGAVTGCIQFSVEDQRGFAALAGSVEKAQEQAKLSGMPAGGGAPINLLVVRKPAGNAVATQVDVRNDGGAPFQEAADLPLCERAVTCAELAAALRQLTPQPVLELP